MSEKTGEGALAQSDVYKIIRCKCGAEILLLPDVAEMDIAIIVHAESHAAKEKDSKKAEAVFGEIQDYLVEQVLIAAAENRDAEIF